MAQETQGIAFNKNFFLYMKQSYFYDAYQISVVNFEMKFILITK